MTLPDLDAAVNEANAKVAQAAHDYVLGLGASPLGSLKELLAERHAAIKARSAADRPQPLTAEEADAIYEDTPASDGTLLNCMQAVLDACRARDLAVIEALPEIDGDAFKRHLTHIRTALLPPNPLTRR